MPRLLTGSKAGKEINLPHVEQFGGLPRGAKINVPASGVLECSPAIAKAILEFYPIDFVQAEEPVKSAKPK